jgi:hypothetical protein
MDRLRARRARWAFGYCFNHLALVYWWRASLMVKIGLKFSGPLKLSKEDKVSMASAIERYLNDPKCQEMRDDVARTIERIKSNSLASSQPKGSG